ncbi:hypothetical protein J2Y03_003914 [Neobacillus niacini]|uniref:DHHW family protein n=1 Tax=Neobacillus niacini TaxID=86668 RepID=UPI00286264D2|nr:DHHW family protein [Neobacillus niacini]MDR7078857.1 hypothetical protein [Neobacillus niacini]
MIIRKINKLSLIILFLFFIFSTGLYFIFSPDLDESHVEYRTLAQQPDMTVDSFANGEYIKDYEEYFTDQFPGRNIWLKLYLNLEKLTGKTFLNGYLVKEDGWIIPEPNDTFTKHPLNLATSNLNEFADFASKTGAEIYFFLLPHKVNTVEVDTPSYINKGVNEEKRNYFISNVSKENLKFVNLGDIFKEKFSQDEINQMYFKTDHHWNITGAFNGYKEITNFLSDNSQYFTEVENEYITKCYNKNFEGSYNRQVYNIVDLKTDRICETLPKDNKFSEFKVSVNGNKSSFEEVYGSGIETKSKLIYADVFTFDLRKINITNPNLKKGNILIVKDSYGSPIIFHLAQHYNKTTVVDLRHSKKQDLVTMVKENEYDSIMFLYNDAALQGDLYEFRKAPK